MTLIYLPIKILFYAYNTHMNENTNFFKIQYAAQKKTTSSTGSYMQFL